MEDNGERVSESDADLSSYTQDVKYSLVDCTKDFTPPEVFLEPVVSPIEADNVINVDGYGRQFVAFYEPGVHKTYSFSLQVSEQSYQDVCGQIEYEMEIVELSRFE